MTERREAAVKQHEATIKRLGALIKQAVAVIQQVEAITFKGGRITLPFRKGALEGISFSLS